MYDQFRSTYLTGVNKMNVDKIENLLTKQKIKQYLFLEGTHFGKFLSSELHQLIVV